MKLQNGYELKSTFIQDFSIAEKFGEKAVKDTFNRAFKEWKDNIEYMTELAIATNLLSWQHHYHDDSELSKIYSDMYYKVKDHVYSSKKFTKEDRDYYYRITD